MPYYQYTDAKTMQWRKAAKAKKQYKDDIAERIKKGTYKSPEQQLKEFSDSIGEFSSQSGKSYLHTEWARKALLEKHTINFTLNDPIKALRRLKFEGISYVRLGVYQVFHTEKPYEKWGEPTHIKIEFNSGGVTLSVLDEALETAQENNV